jgi:gas vesicle protein
MKKQVKARKQVKKVIVKKTSAKSVVAGTLLGLVAGGIAGILLAPKSGKETRAELSEHFDEIKNKFIDELKKAEEFSKETYYKIVQKVVSAFEQSKKINEKEALNIKKKLETHFNEIKRKFKTTTNKK